MSRQNALWNCKNPYQGDYVKALCVCSAGLLRSPTIAWVMSNNGYNTRSAGVHSYALLEIDEVLMNWADIVICAEKEHEKILKSYYPNATYYTLDLPDKYAYRDPELVDLITTKLKELKLID